MIPNTIDSNLLRQIFFILIILFLGIVLFLELWFFLSALLGSITFYVMMRERMFFLTERKGWKRSTAAWVLMLLSFFVILVPIGLLANILYSKVSYVVTHSSDMMIALKQTADNLSKKIGYELVRPSDINQLGTKLAQLLPKILGVTFDTITLIAAMYFILFFMLVNGHYMEDSLYQYIPLKDDNVDSIGKEVKRMVVANTIGIPLIAKGLGFVQSVYLKTQKDRIIPYVACGLYYFWMWYVLKNQPAFPQFLVMLSLAIFLASSAGLIINSFMKISMHGLSLGVMMCFMLIMAFTSDANFGVYLAVALGITGLVLSARLINSDHYPAEVYAGFFVGVLCQLIAAQFA